MRPIVVWTIFRKEITETLRDWRTLLMMAGLPVILYPLLLVGGTQVKESQAQAMEARQSTIAVWGDLPDELVARLTKRADLTCVLWRGADEALRADLEAGRIAPPAVDAGAAEKKGPELLPGVAAGSGPAAAGPAPADHPVIVAARAAISRREVDAVLLPFPGFAAALTGGETARLALYFDWVRPDSKQARDRIRAEISAWRDDLVRRRLEERGLPEGFVTAVDLSTQDIAPPQRVSGDVLGTAVAFLLILMSLLGGLYPSIDLTAGEKERGTMETLLCVPLRSTEIIVGKFLTVWTISIATGLANLISIGATLSRVLPGSAAKTLALTPGAFALIFLLYVPVAFITSAVFLAVGVFAKDFKDGQNLVTPVYMIFALPAGAVMMPGIELSPGTAFVPVLNLALLIKALLVGEARADLVFLTLLSSGAYGALAVMFAARVFASSQVLLGGRESLRTTLGLDRRGGLPSPAFACVMAAVMLVVLFYGSLLLEGRGIAFSLVAMQLGLILAPTLAVVAAFGFPFRATLSLRRPPLLGLAAAALIGVSAWTFAAGVLGRLFPMPEELVRQMEKLFSMDPGVPLWGVVLVLAVGPAICEELLFRGLILSGMRRLGPWWAIGITALLFGLFHASLYRLLPTAFLGVLLGWIVWRTGSIWCGMLAHALNNGLAAVLAHAQQAADGLGAKGGEPLPWSWTLGGAAVTAVGLWALSRVRATESANGHRDSEAQETPARNSSTLLP